MLNAEVLTFQEFATREPLPLATIHNAVLEFLRRRKDVVVFGATAVNAYVTEPRMTQDIDLMSVRAEELAEELRAYLSDRFHIAVQIRTIAGGKGYRVFQIQKKGNRHFVGVYFVDSLPKALSIEEILIAAPPQLIARKVIACHSRRGQPKSGTDWRDLAMLILAFPELKSELGPVSDALGELKANEAVMNEWKALVAQQINAPSDEDEFS